MAIPKFSDLFTEVLQSLVGEEMLHRRDLINRVVDTMTLTEEERVATFAGGTNIARNRAQWALEFLCQAGAVERPRRGYAAITEFGKQLLREGAPKVTIQRLRQTDGLKEWKQRHCCGDRKMRSILISCTTGERPSRAIVTSL